MAPSGLPDEVLNLSSIELLIIQALPNHTLEALEEPDSPQSLAHQWLLTDLEENNYTLTSRLKQRFALASLFHATNGEDWLVNDHWLNHSVHECFWFARETFLDVPTDNFSYVEVTNPNPCEMPPEQINGSRAVNIEHNHYQHIWLHSNSLQGSLPLELFWLTDLRSISLYNNQDVAGSIPSNIGKLSKVEALNLGGTSLSGSLPTEIGLLSDSMFSIAIINAQLEGNLPSELGTLPTEIGLLSDVKDFAVYGNSFTGTIPSQVGLMSSVENLDFDENYISGTFPSEVFLLTNMRRFWACCNVLTGTIPSEFGGIATLEWFQSGSNALTGTIPAEFEQLPLLNTLDLEHNMLSGSLPQGLSPHIEWLDVTNNSMLTGPLPAQFTNLFWLFLEGTQISGILPHYLCDIDTLEFDCSAILCGCGCSCMNETNTTFSQVMNSTNGDASRV
ncbi:Leucine Rich Repeat [Seminavis robusta]|uniref:Leucine Rich Repeat n=1 Tax=Seminavis robusta TaxID=568900 RepID=A0A9N8EEQ8_9STRA|nr:Leucine Rich Repeat [Seminavis robusta]|eukprot:Sro1073_g238220.1 Leucine Rich Repeat (447) ;mRNA; r:25577-27108